MSETVYALVDTGASVSCISEDLYHQLGLNQDYPLQPPNIPTIHGVSNRPMPVRGEAVVPCTIANVEITLTLLVVPQLNIPLILGMDFITEHRVVLDFSCKRLSLYDEWASAYLCDVRGNTPQAKTACEIRIPPRTEVVFDAIVDRRLSAPVSVLEPDPHFSSQWQIIPARVVLNPATGRCPCRILNPTNALITLPAGVIIGKLEPVEELTPSACTPEAEVNVLDTNETNALHSQPPLNFDFSNSDLTCDQKQQMISFLHSQRDVFATDLSELGFSKIGQMDIDTGNHPPVRQRPYRVSPHIKQEIDKQVDEMLKHNIISPSTSCYASPVVMVKKKSGEYRFAIDYRKLNSITTTINYPLPKFEDVTDLLGKATIFSVMDLMSGFWQIGMSHQAKHKTAFICHSGLYEFERLPFGLKNSPTVFQAVLESALKGLHYKTALVYVDDIIAFSPDFDTHLQHLADIFDHLRKAGLKLKPSKCNFAVKQVLYLGHVISKEGVSADPEKVRIVQEFPVPNTQRDVRSFLGLANYYRKFVKDFAKIAFPLNRLLAKQVPFQWTNECQDAFERLKQALTSPPILAFPDFDREFILYTDASSTAISYILGQTGEQGKERVISYNGRSLRSSEKNWSISERETLALVEGIKAFRVYLAGRKFIVKTDHYAIQFLNNTRDLSGRLGRWAILLQEYDFEVQYKPGKIHGNADGLSRRPYAACAPEVDNGEGDLPTLFPLCPDNPGHVNKLDVRFQPMRDLLVGAIEPGTVAVVQRQDAQLLEMIQYLSDGVLPSDDKAARKLILESEDHILDEGVLYHLWYPRAPGHRNDRVIKQLVVPVQLRNDVLLSFHDSLIGGAHQGIERTYSIIRERYYWPGMYADIAQYVRSCLDCQQSKQTHRPTRPPLHPLPHPNLFQRLHIDFLGPLETSKEGYKYILLIVDAYSKWPEAFPLVTADATEVAWVLYREIFCRYGAPDSLLSDRGQAFLSKLVSELCQIFQVTRLRTSSYHAQTNAQCERFNSYIASSLRSLCQDKTKDWPDKLPSILSAYRVTPCTQSTQFTPYFLLFKQECRLPLDVSLIPSTNLPMSAQQCMNDILSGIEITQKLVRANVADAQRKYKTQYDKQSQPHRFVVGQRVWVYFPVVKQGTSHKLQRKWRGPYYICTELQGNAFILRQCSDNKQLRSPVHAVRLKPFFDPQDRPTNHLPQIDAQAHEAESDGSEIDSDDQSVTSNADTNDELNQSNSPPDNPDCPSQPDNLSQTSEEDMFEVDKILACRTRNGQKFYRIKWKGHPQTTWEPQNNIPSELIRHFHINKTHAGRSKKK